MTLAETLKHPQLVEWQIDLYSYLADLFVFADKNGLGKFLSHDVDHVAFKLPDTRQFGKTINTLIPFVQKWAVEKDVYGNYRATVVLDKPLLMSKLGNARVLQIVNRDPRNSLAGSGLHHIGIYVPCLDEVTAVLQNKDIFYARPGNESSPFSLAVPLNLQGQEVWFRENPAV